METSINDFLGQIPIGFVLMPIIFGILYIFAMVIIFRRAAERRRKRSEQAALGFVPNAKPTPSQPSMASLTRFARPAQAQSALSGMVLDVPEPEFDLLTSEDLLDAAESTPISAPATVSNNPNTPMSNALTVAQETLPAAPAPKEEKSIMVMTDRTTDNDAPQDAVEVMRVWRDINDGTLIFQVGKERFRAVSEIANPDVLRRVSAIARDLWGMVHGGNAAASSGMGQVTAPRATGTMQQLPPATPTQAPRQPYAAQEIEKPQGGMFGRMVRGAKGQKEKEEPQGIADQIEIFLQGKLSASAEYSARSIHIRPALDHGVKIEVDGIFYDGIDEVPEDDVRDYLFGMMREWEARQ